MSVRSRIHEYGGAAHFADDAGLLYTDLDEQALWWLDTTSGQPGGEPVRLTPRSPRG